MSDRNREQPGTQRIALSDALAAIDRVEPVEPREAALAEALGFALAADAGPSPDAARGAAVRLTGARLRRIDIAVLGAHGVTRASVRAPRIAVVAGLDTDEPADAARRIIGGAVAAEGGVALTGGVSLDTAFGEDEADALVAIGGGEARDDRAVGTLATLGRVEFDGVQLAPGGGIAFGYAGERSVLLLPGQFDAALCGWLALGRRLLARLAFRLIEEQPYLLELARPIAATRGVAQVVIVRRRAAQAEPVMGEWSAQGIARADGWIMVPAESDGLAAGSKVQMRPWA